MKALTIKREDLIAVLDECEWGSHDGEDGYLNICPVCDAVQTWDHEPGCKLKAVLNALRAGVQLRNARRTTNKAE